MIEYISTASKNHFLLLNVQMDVNFQSSSVVRNGNKFKLI